MRRRCLRSLNPYLSHSLYPRGFSCSSTTSASLNTAPTNGDSKKTLSIFANLVASQTSSWSLRAMTSPQHRETASSKFLVEPRLDAFSSNLTGNGASRAKRLMMSTVSSLEPSSQITNSSGGRDWEPMLPSCSCKNLEPLYVHSATDNLGISNPDGDFSRLNVTERTNLQRN